MAHAQPVQGGIPGTIISLKSVVAVTVATIAIVAALALGELRLFGPAADPPGTLSPAVLRSAVMWEAERRAQMGEVDPVLQSGKDWERQRRQQSGEF